MNDSQKSGTTWVRDNNLVIQVGPNAKRVEYINSKPIVVRDAIVIESPQSDPWYDTQPYQSS